MYNGERERERIPLMCKTHISIEAIALQKKKIDSIEKKRKKSEMTLKI